MEWVKKISKIENSENLGLGNVHLSDHLGKPETFLMGHHKLLFIINKKYQSVLNLEAVFENEFYVYTEYFMFSIFIVLLFRCTIIIE